MAWGGWGRNSGIVRTYTYAHMLKQFENTKPIRGRATTGIKPLGRRNAVDAYSMRMGSNGEVECLLWGAVAVTYHRDDTITVHHAANRSTMSLANFVTDLLRVAAYQHDYKLELRVQDKQYALGQNTTLKLKHDGNQFHVIDAPTSRVHHIRRAVAKRVRAQYEGIVNYVSGMAKLRDEHITEDELKLVFGEKEHSYMSNGATRTWSSPNTPRFMPSKPEDVALLFRWLESDDPTEMYKGALWLMWQSQWGYYGKVCEPAAVCKLDTFILAKHKEEVFEEIELPEGVVRKDRYSWAFN